MLPSVSMRNCCSDHSLHEACLKLNYNAVKHVIGHNVIDINHVTAFSQTVNRNEDDGTTNRGFITKHFKHRYCQLVTSCLEAAFSRIFIQYKPFFRQVTPAFCMLFENIRYADSDIPEIDKQKVTDILRIFKVSLNWYFQFYGEYGAKLTPQQRGWLTSKVWD